MSKDAADRTVVIERLMAHSQDKVWRALTQGALLEDWLMKNDFRAEVGHKFRFRADPNPHWDGIVEGEVLEVEPQTLLSYRWDTTGAGGLRTVVRWTLTPAKGGVLLRMEQAGFPAAAEANYRGAEWGWQKFLGALEGVLTRIS
jgi:uncharacterized protein YndB with AHSA1/START domain